MGTVTQKFYSCELTFWYEEGMVFEEKVQELCNNLMATFGQDCIVNSSVSREDGFDYLHITLGSEKDGYYYSTECDYEPYHPATKYDKYGDPGSPADGGYVECYDSTREMLRNVWKCPIEWGYDVDEEDFDTEEALWEKLCEDDGPDPDAAYEQWRDEHLFD